MATSWDKRKAVQRMQDHIEARLHRPITLQGLGRTQEAFGALERALELDPLNESAIQTAARLRAALAR